MTWFPTPIPRSPSTPSAWQRAKNHIPGGPGVELVANTVVINNPSDPVKTVHFGAAFPELIDGWKWLDGFKQ